MTYINLRRYLAGKKFQRGNHPPGHAGTAIISTWFEFAGKGVEANTSPVWRVTHDFKGWSLNAANLSSLRERVNSLFWYTNNFKIFTKR